MAGAWITDITHFLDEQGEMIKEPFEAREMAEYFAAIIVMATYPEPEYPTEYKISCRRGPPCLEEIIAGVDPETDEIFWKCLKCGECGLISNWQGTIWDMSEIDGVH